MKEGYNVGSDVTVSLEFRSTGLDGVLLGVSSAKIDAIGLELVNGQVIVVNKCHKFICINKIFSNTFVNSL